MRRKELNHSHAVLEIAGKTMEESTCRPRNTSVVELHDCDVEWDAILEEREDKVHDAMTERHRVARTPIRGDLGQRLRCIRLGRDAAPLDAKTRNPLGVEVRETGLFAFRTPSLGGGKCLDVLAKSVLRPGWMARNRCVGIGVFVVVREVVLVVVPVIIPVIIPVVFAAHPAEGRVAGCLIRVERIAEKFRETLIEIGTLLCPARCTVRILAAIVGDIILAGRRHV